MFCKKINICTRINITITIASVIPRLRLQRVPSDKSSMTDRCIDVRSIGREYSERARDMDKCGLYMGVNERGRWADPWLTRQVISGWRGQLERVSVASHLGFGSADRAAASAWRRGWRRVVPVVTSGRDVRAWRPWWRPSLSGWGCLRGITESSPLETTLRVGILAQI
jgi:hypothetical protein